MKYSIHEQIVIPRRLVEVFAFFAEARNLERITPPWMAFHIITPMPIEMHEGANIEYKLRVHGLPLKWLTQIERWRPPFEFVDVQEKGPYKLWRHTHRFREVEGGTRVEDIVEYELPFGVLGRLVHWLQVRSDVAEIFEYRALRIRELLG
jgi:ligand-binding SRPBCC domain-containing protein